MVFANTRVNFSTIVQLMEDAEAFVREYALYIGATEQDALMEIERRMRSAGVRETGIASDLFSGFFGFSGIFGNQYILPSG